ncbi:MAG TPA: phage tail protein [Pyrinomonadaceae bacterium]|jgi:phage tail-like protein
MANSANETVIYPFTAFSFAVEIDVPDVSTKVCSAAFSECDGLEMSQEIKTIREGGNNGKQIRLSGPVTYGQLTLKRGMTATFDLWNWFSAALNNPALRAKAEVVLLAPDGKTERARFVLARCIPTKLKAPPLNGTTGTVAIEEFQLVYESITLKPPQGGAGGGPGGGGGFGFSASASASASISGGGASASASASASAGGSFGF